MVFLIPWRSTEVVGSPTKPFFPPPPLRCSMSENWDEEADQSAVAAAATTAVVAELPEIKLFGKWSCEEVNISDMSLQVRKKLLKENCVNWECPLT